MKKKVVFVANTSWYLYNFRLALIKSIQKCDFKTIVIAPFDDEVKFFKSEGIECFDLPLNRKGLNPISNLLTFFRLLCVYYQTKPDYIYHFTIKPVIFGTLAARFVTKAKIINNITGLGFVFIGSSPTTLPVKRFVKLLYKLTLNHSYAITFQNIADKVYFIQNKLVDKQKVKIYVIQGSGVNLTKFRRTAIRTEKHWIRYILVGRMLWDKGIGDYIEAIKMIKNNNKDAQFGLLGPIDTDNPASIDAPTISNWVERGYVNYYGGVKDVRPYLEQADIFVLPSYREGLSKSIIEAMAMEMPIITTNVPGCKETVVPGVNGIIIPVKDPMSLKNAMEFFIRNPLAIKEMGSNSRKIAAEKFADPVINSAFLAIMGINK